MKLEYNHHNYHYRGQPWVVCFSGSLFFFFVFIQLNLPNTLGPYLISAFHINVITLGALSASYFYTVVFMLFPAGMLLDRFSTRKIIIFAFSLCIICTIGFAVSQTLWQAILCRALIGVGGAFVLLSNVRLASRWFPSNKLAFIIGLIITFAMFGGLVAQTPATLLIEALGWRYAMLIDGLIGIAMLIVVICCVTDHPPGHHETVQEQKSTLRTMGFWLMLGLVAKNAQNWLAGLYTSLMNLPIFLFGALWGGLYLMQIHGLTTKNASLVTSMLFIGTMIGSPVLGWLSDTMGRRLLPMIVSAILAIGVILVMMFVTPLPLWILVILFFALGFITSSQVISYPLITESNSPLLTATAEGLASIMIMAGGFTQPLFGWLMQLHWSHKLVNKVPIYTNSNFQTAIIILPIAFFMSAILAFLAKETFCKNITQN